MRFIEKYKQSYIKKRIREHRQTKEYKQQPNKLFFVNFPSRFLISIHEGDIESEYNLAYDDTNNKLFFFRRD